MNLEEVTHALDKVDNWALERNAITKQFEFNTFKQAIDFVNHVAKIAEKHEHHPDILIRYGLVFLTLTTHTHGGLTPKDFEVAEEIDKIESPTDEPAPNSSTPTTDIKGSDNPDNPSPENSNQ